MLSNHLIFCCSLLLLPSILPSISVFSSESALHMRWPKYLLSPPDTSTTEHHFHIGTAASFFLELLVIALCCPPIAYWTPSDLGRGVVFIFWCHIFCLFILFMGFSQQEYWSDFPFQPPVDHVLSELFTKTCSSWVALKGMVHCITDLHKPLLHAKAVIHKREDNLELYNDLHHYSNMKAK